MIRKAIPLLVLALAAGCSSKDADLQRFIETTKQEQPGGVKPLPEVKPQETFTYAAQNLRSPFMPGGSGNSSSGVRPNSNRARENLEQFPLDTMAMKGTLQIGGRTYALVQTRDGLVHRVLPGSYMGQNEGRIVKIEPSRITLSEIIADGLGGFIERPATLALAE
ncbi:MAG TPA: pilus assembly protein PilP [Steroidobacteraceae bacterium]|nr:pilus assembly protein PilP [Steroidobacteraceae bacterium]